MKTTNVVPCQGSIHDFFQVLEIEGLDHLKTEGDIGLLFRVFPQRSLEWALNSDYRKVVVKALKFFSDSMHTPIVLSYGALLEGVGDVVVLFVLTGRKGIYLFPVAKFTHESREFFLPMNMTMTSGEVIKKGTRVAADYQIVKTPEGEYFSVCLIFLDNDLLRGMEN